MNGKRKILLALHGDDAKACARDLVKMGYDVYIAADGAKALELIVQESPSIVVIDLRIPVIAGERVFRIVKNNPNTWSIPFVFVSLKGVEIEGFRSGVDSLLLKPFKAEELYARIRDILILTSGRQRISGHKELEGRLDGIALSDIIQIIYMNKREGELIVRRGDESGVIYFKGGHICDAELGDMVRTKALFRLLSWKGARFEFYSQPVDVKRHINTTTGNLLIEGMRQIDELRRALKGGKAKKFFPAKDSFLRLRIDPSSPPGDLSPHEREVLGLVEQYPGVKDLVDRSSLTDYEVYSALSDLIKKGLVEELKPEQKARGTMELLNAGESMRLREAVTRLFPDLSDTNQIKVLLASPRTGTMHTFLEACKLIPDFRKRRTGLPDNDPPVGEAGDVEFSNGMEAVFFIVPAARGMAPVWSAFSTHLAGLALIWDCEGDGDDKALDALSDIKDHILAKRSVPVVHVAVSSKKGPPPPAVESFRKRLKMADEETLFYVHGSDGAGVRDALRSVFTGLIKAKGGGAAL